MEVIIALVAFAIFIIFQGVKMVPQGYEYTVERFGKYVKTFRPGLNFMVPFMYRVGDKMNMMETVLDVPSQEVITKDNAMISG